MQVRRPSHPALQLVPEQAQYLRHVGQAQSDHEVIPYVRSLVLVKTVYHTASSLDGFIATPDDSLEWLFPLGELEATSYPAFIRDVGALAMGSATYERMLRHLISPESPRSQPWPYTQPAWVFRSRALPARPVGTGFAELHYELPRPR